MQFFGKNRFYKFILEYFNFFTFWDINFSNGHLNVDYFIVDVIRRTWINNVRFKWTNFINFKKYMKFNVMADEYLFLLVGYKFDQHVSENNAIGINL